MILVGGPLDGVTVELRSRRAFIWVDVRTGNTCYTMPKRHRVLYRRSTWREGFGRVREGYVYAGHTHARCDSCGAYIETVYGHVQSCVCCGEALATLR